MAYKLSPWLASSLRLGVLTTAITNIQGIKRLMLVIGLFLMTVNNLGNFEV